MFNSLVENQESTLANSANIPYSQPGRSPGTSTLDDTTNSQLREAAVSSLSSSVQGHSSPPGQRYTAGSAQDIRAQQGDIAGSAQGATAPGDSLISLLGDMAGST